jgi:AcrR family transcriptional regulator
MTSPLSAGDGAFEDGRSRRWDQHRVTRRAELIDAAISAIRRHGAAVGMDDIAAEAGTSKAGLYRYFADKEDLHVAVGSKIAADLVGDVSAALARERDPRRILAAAIDAFLSVIETDPEPYRFVVHRPLLDRPAARDPLADYTSVVATHASEVIAERLRGAGLDPAPAEVWGHALVGYVRAGGDWWLEHPTMSRRALVDHLTTLVWSGLGGIDASPASGSRWR